jgi:dihydrolipoamide dehydrogenase
VVVGEIAEGVDLLVVGGGPGGYAAALRGAQLGREVVLVERDGETGLGGTCVRVGCIPSKALIELADGCHRARTWAAKGLEVEGVHVDLRRFQEWKTELVSGLTRGVDWLLRHQRVRIIRGVVTFNKPNRAVVDTQDGNVTFFEFRSAIVATGSAPLELGELPRDGEFVLDSSDALSLTEIPRNLVVVGAGYIGVEIGTAFAKLGSEVTVIEALDRPLPTMEPALGRTVLRSLRALGVDVLLDSKVVGGQASGVVVRGGGEERMIAADRVVVAIGRRPLTREVGLEMTGARLDERAMVIVDPGRLASKNVAAVGDVTPGPALAHKATAEAEVAAMSVSGKAARFEPAAIPAVVFSDPEIASVGLTEEDARNLGLDVGIANFPMSASGRAAILGSRVGFARLVVDRMSDSVVGAHLAGPHVSELAGEVALAIEMGASPEDLAGTIHPHPTISESVHEAALLAVDRPLHFMSDSAGVPVPEEPM